MFELTYSPKILGTRCFPISGVSAKARQCEPALCRFPASGGWLCHLQLVLPGTNPRRGGAEPLHELQRIFIVDLV